MYIYEVTPFRDSLQSLAVAGKAVHAGMSERVLRGKEPDVEYRGSVQDRLQFKVIVVRRGD